MLKRFICCLLCAVMLTGIFPTDMPAEAVSPSVAAAEELNKPGEEAVQASAAEAPEAAPVLADPQPPAEEPIAPQPAAEEPAAEEPAVEEPAAEEPAEEEPAAEEPAAEEPAEEEPAAEEPAAEEPAAEEPAAEEPAAEEPAAEEPAAEEPAAEEPAAEEPAEEEPAAEEPAAEEPAAEEPAEEEPTDEEPVEEPSEEDLAEEPAAVYFDPQRAEYDLAVPAHDLDVTLLEGAPAFLGIEGLSPDTDYRVSGGSVTLLAAWLSAQPLGEVALPFLFEGEETRPFYLNVVDSAAAEEAKPAEESEPAEEMALMPLGPRGDIFNFSSESINETRYLNAPDSDQYVDIYQSADVSAYGEGVWALSNVTGSAVESLTISYQTPSYCRLRIGRLISAGTVTATLTYTAGEFSQEIPVSITVSDVEVPTGIDMPSVYRVGIHETLVIPRPGLLPANSASNADDFNFWLSFEDGVEATLLDDGGYELTFTEAGYRQGRASMSGNGFYLVRNFIIEVADASGSVPGNPFDFSDESVNETRYLKAPNSDMNVDVHQYADVSAYGGGVWALSNVTGSAVESLTISYQTPSSCVLRIGRLISAGTVTATLTYTAGEFSQEIPVSITVSDAEVPTGIDMPSVYRVSLGETLVIPRPGLLPANTAFNADDFDFWLYFEDGAEARQLDDGGYELTFAEAGYFPGYASMSGNSFYLVRNFIIEVADASGSVPGEAVAFEDESLETTVFYAGETVSCTLYVRMRELQSAYGTPVFTVEDVNGTSASDFRVIENSGGWSITLLFNANGYGDTTARLVCTVGEHTASLPILIHVPQLILPTALDMPSVFSGTVNENISVNRPGLLPSSQQLDIEDFEFDLSVYGPDGGSEEPAEYDDVNNAWILRLSEPGYYTATAEMWYSNIRLTKTLSIVIKDESGNVPGSVFEFSRESVNETRYLKAPDIGGDVYVSQNADVSAYGEGVWALSNVTGSAVERLTIAEQSPSFCVLRIGRLISAGEVAATLTYTAGELSQEIPVSITVSDAELPTGIDMPSVYRSSIHETLVIPRPGLLPADTDFNADDFSFWLSVNGAEARPLDDGGYELTFTEAGYHNGYATMHISGLTLGHGFVVEVADTSGTVPGEAVAFEDESLEITIFYTGETETHFLYVPLTKLPIAYGTPVFTVEDVEGTSASGFSAAYEDDVGEGVGEVAKLSFKVNGYGDTTARLVCTVGEYTASLPILIHVPQLILPTGLDMPTVFSGAVNEEITVARPGLLPVEQELDPADFYFDILVIYDEDEADYPGRPTPDGSALVFTFAVPGYYKAIAGMSHQNLDFDKPIIFAIADESGEVPGSTYAFSQTSLTKTLYTAQTDASVGVIFLSKLLPDLGMGVWSLRKVTADAPDLSASLLISEDRLEETYELAVAGELIEGAFSYEITCVINGQTVNIPVTLTISSGRPASLLMEQTVFTIDTGVWFTPPRPQFDPGDTGIDGDSLVMSIGTGPELSEVSDEGEYEVKVHVPGYYELSVYLMDEETGFSVGTSVLLIVREQDGTLPGGSPLHFEEDEVALKIFRSFSPEVAYAQHLENLPTALGEIAWTLTRTAGSAVTGQVDASGLVTFNAAEQSGESVFLLTASAGGYEAGITFTVTVDDSAVPKGMTPLNPQTSLTVGQEVTLSKPELTPAGTELASAFEYSVYFESGTPVQVRVDTENEKTFCFTEPGYYTATVIMAYSGLSFEQQILFTVSLAGSQPPAPVLISELYFSEDVITLKAGKTTYLSPIMQPVNPSNPLLDWTSSDDSVVKVENTGLIRALASGEAVITASAQDASGKSAQIKVVVPAVDMSGVRWQEMTSFTFDGTEKSVLVTGLPEGVSAVYENNTATDIGEYTATVTFESKAFDVSGAQLAPLDWEITAPFDEPFRAAPKITEVQAVSAASLKLAWTAVNGAGGYNIYVSARPNDSYTLLASTTALSHSISGLKAGDRYFYKVEAYDLIGGLQFVSSPLSAWAAGVPMASPAITAISSPSIGMITLSWNKPAGVAGYQVMFATAKNGPYKAVRTQFTNSVTFRGLKSGLTCYFKIRPYKKFYAYAYFGPESPVRVIKVK